MVQYESYKFISCIRVISLLSFKNGLVRNRIPHKITWKGLIGIHFVVKNITSSTNQKPWYK